MPDATAFVLEKPSPAIRRGELIEDVGLVRDTGEFIPLLEVGWDVPCHTVVGFATAAVDQGRIVVAFRCRAPGPVDSRSLGEIEIQLTASPDPLESAVDLTLAADENSLFVSAASSPEGVPLPISWNSEADA
jgi:hypothetical protein